MVVNVKKIPWLYIIPVVIILLFSLYFSRGNVNKQWQEFSLNREFICPENLTKEKSEEYLSKFTKFYITNYPNITFNDFLSRRMQQLVTNKCTVTLQNLANQNNGILPDQDSVNELKNMPHSSTNKTLLEMGQSFKENLKR